MLVLTECSQEYLNRLNNLKSIIPSYFEDNSLYTENPFILYILEKNRIETDLLDFFEHTEYLQRLNDVSLLYSKKLFDGDAALEWYELLDFVYEEDFENWENDYDAILICFNKGLSCSSTEDLIKNNSLIEFVSVDKKELEDKGNSEVAENFKMILSKHESYTLKLENELEITKMKLSTLEGEKDGLLRQLSDVFKSLENSYSLVQESKKELFKYKVEVKELREKLSVNERILKANNEKAEEYISRISEQQELIDNSIKAVSGYEKKIIHLQFTVEDKDKEISRLKSMLEKKDFDVKSESNVSEKPISEIFEESFSSSSEILDIDEDTTSESVADESVAEFNLLSEPDDVVELEDEDFSFHEPETIIEEKVESEPENPEINYEDVKEISYDTDTVVKKSNWFLTSLYGFSKKNFLKQTKDEQISIIFLKMMEKKFEKNTSMMVRKNLENLGDNVPLFDLYKLICNEPSSEVISSFFVQYSNTN